MAFRKRVKSLMINLLFLKSILTNITFLYFNSDENSEADQVDYKKALDLVEYIAPLGGGNKTFDLIICVVF